MRTKIKQFYLCQHFEAFYFFQGLNALLCTLTTFIQYLFFCQQHGHSVAVLKFRIRIERCLFDVFVTTKHLNLKKEVKGFEMLA